MSQYNFNIASEEQHPRRASDAANCPLPTSAHPPHSRWATDLPSSSEPARVSFGDPTTTGIQEPRPSTTPIRRRFSTVCKVPICSRVNCALRSHQRYAEYIAQYRRQRLRSAQAESQLPTVVEGGVDGLPSLPIEGPHMAVYRSLFHDFFTIVRPRMTGLLFPPPLNSTHRAFAKEMQTSYFALATQNSLHCLNTVAAAYFQQIIRRRGFTHDPTTMTLYGMIIRQVREKLDVVEPEEIDRLMQVILTMVVFDIARGTSKSVLVHQEGIKQLVNKVGGLHNLRFSLPWVMCLDRLVAYHNGQKPMYCTRMNRALHRPIRLPTFYGTAFDGSWLPTDITDFCQDICRTVELLEGQQIDSLVRKAVTMDVADCHYFFFLRNQIEDEFVFLNAKYWDMHGRTKCILLAAKIVEYTVLLDNYIVTTTAIAGDRLRKEFDRLDSIEEEWKEMPDALHWVLFALQILPDIWTGKAWAFSMLKSFLVRKYVKHGSWPEGWKQVEMQNLRRFIWSDAKLERITMNICNRIDEHST